MNFKLTLWKTIISILVIILIDLFLANSVKVECMLVEGGSCPQPEWDAFIFEPLFVLISVLMGLIVYIIWSFTEKK